MDDVYFLAAGFAIGMFAAFIVALSAWSQKRALRKNLEERDRQILQLTKLQHSERDDLEKKIEKLESTVAKLRKKPGRDEQHRLKVYEEALRSMSKKMPGFASSWEHVVEEADRAVSLADGEKNPLLKRIFGSRS